MSGPLTIALLYLMGVINGKEANILQEKIPGSDMPKNWISVIAQFETAIGRPLFPQDPTWHPEQ